jgi:hypothetical protein
VYLRADFPFVQVQPLPRQAYADETLSSTTIVPSMAAMSDEDWDAYNESVVAPNQNPERGFGGYAVAARQRRHGVCPFSKSKATG